MIKISDGWEIDKGAYGGYVLRHNTGRTAYDKKTNTMKPVYDYQIYPASFEDCILRMKDKMFMDSIHNEDMTLDEAITRYQTISGHIEDELKGRMI